MMNWTNASRHVANVTFFYLQIEELQTQATKSKSPLDSLK